MATRSLFTPGTNFFGKDSILSLSLDPSPSASRWRMCAPHLVEVLTFSPEQALKLQWRQVHSGLNLTSCLRLSDCFALQLSSATLDLWQTGNLSWLLTTSSLDRKIHYYLKSKICLASTHKSQTSMTFSGFPMLHTDIWPAISNKNITNGAEIRKWNLKQNLEYEGCKKKSHKS